MMGMRVGYGEDAHALAPGRKLVVGGVALPSARGALAHSDGDALLHALADALLSALALGDIGDYFPPSDPALAGMDSAAILNRVLELCRGHRSHRNKNRRPHSTSKRKTRQNDNSFLCSGARGRDGFHRRL